MFILSFVAKEERKGEKERGRKEGRKEEGREGGAYVPGRNKDIE